jgi:uncharacterized protein YndB with AHSA1/START domain
LTTRALLLRKETVTSVSLESAWKTWTTAEGVTSFFAPKVNIDPRVGGPYELFFDLKAPRGFQGTEGCKVLGVDAQKNLAFEFLAPPQFPNARRVHTRVDVKFEEVLNGGLVKVSLVHSGFREGEEWDECLDFFNWSWDLVLGRFGYTFLNGPVDWNHPYVPQGLTGHPRRKLRDSAST